LGRGSFQWGAREFGIEVGRGAFSTIGGGFSGRFEAPWCTPAPPAQYYISFITTGRFSRGFQVSKLPPFKKILGFLHA
jgi:hypothetical protein